jgi:hypothetical protein
MLMSPIHTVTSKPMNGKSLGQVDVRTSCACVMLRLAVAGVVTAAAVVEPAGRLMDNEVQVQ